MEHAEHSDHPWWRAHIGVLAAVIAAAIAMTAALVTRSSDSHVTSGIESASATSTNLLSGAATALPFGYAFGAGMVAAVNPCGFALLPVFLGLYLGTQESPDTERFRGRRVRHAVWISAVVTASFVLLFGIMGLILSAVTTAITGAFPWIGLIVGVMLVLFGAAMLHGDARSASLGSRLAGRFSDRARQSNTRGYFAYGLAYGLASLGCTLPIFLTVIGGTLTVRSLPAASAQFVLYALGMGFILTLLTFSAAFFKYTAMRGVRRITRYVHPASAALMLAAGTYLIYYWLTLGGLLDRVGLH